MCADQYFQPLNSLTYIDAQAKKITVSFPSDLHYPSYYLTASYPPAWWIYRELKPQDRRMDQNHPTRPVAQSVLHP